MRFEDIAQLRRDFYVPSENESLNYIGLEHINQQSLDLNGIGDSATVVSQKNRFFSGDILFGKLRPYFRKVVRPKFDGVCSTDIWVINAKPGIDQAYLFYLLASPKFIDASVAGSSGTRMPRADWDYLSETEWDIPTHEVQKRIGEILSSLDDKIELNRRINETLEAIAQAIFKEWFVDFNYPGATGKLVPSPLGPIPEDWEVHPMSKFYKLEYGKGLKNDKRESGSIPVYGSNGIIGYHNEHFTEGPGIVIGRKGSVGNVFWVNENFFPIDTTFFVSSTMDDPISPFDYYMFEEINLPVLTSDSAVPGLNRNEALGVVSVFPNFKVKESFNFYAKVIFETITQIKSEIIALGKIRDNILNQIYSY